jgi:hypothetical protein
MTNETFDRDFWERRWTQALSHIPTSWRTGHRTRT